MTLFIVRLLVNAVALAAAAFFIDGITYDSWIALIIVALIFGLVNAIIKPIITLLTCPLVALTLGIFILVINGLMLWLTGWLAGLIDIGFHVEGFWAAFWGAIIVSIVSFILNVFVKDN